jgi:hypothetical protein
MKQYPIATICGSMKFYDDMLATAQDLTGQGWIVLMPFVKKGEGSTDIAMLDDMHRRKIDMASRVVVVTRDDYFGQSTRDEIEYALTHDKLVTHHDYTTSDTAGDADSERVEHRLS